MDQLKSQISNTVVTQITEFKGFTPAKDSEQDYYNKNSENEHCSGYIRPKIAKFLRHLPDL